MPNRAKLFANKLNARLATKADDLPRYPAVIGDGYGNVFFGSSKSAVYVRVGNQLSTAICTRVQPTDGLAVWVGYANEERTLYQVLSLRTIDAPNANAAGGYAPANRYRYLAKGGGQDPLWLELRAWLPLRVGMTSPASTSVTVYEGNIWSGTEFIFVASQSVDLSSHIPATSGKAAWVLLTVDNTGAIVDTKGSEVDLADLSTSADVFENAPSIPAGTVDILALVRVYEGQTEIREGRATLAGDGSGFTDIIDLRGTYQWQNEPYWYNNASAGRLWGGVITDAGGGTVDISAGAGLVKTGGSSIDGDMGVPTATNEGQGSNIQLVQWAAQEGFALAGVGYNLIYWDASANGFAVQLRENFYANFNFVTDFTIGRVYYDGTNVTIRLCGMNRWNFDRRVQMFGEERFPVERATGLMLSATGTRNIAITAGVVWAELVNRFSIDAFDSSGADRFTYWYRNGSGGWTSSASQSQINNTNYDDGDGTLGTLTANRYGVHWVYVVHDSSVHVVYGQGDYTLAQSQLTTPPATLPGILSAYATFIGRIIIQKSASSFTEIDSAFTTNLGVSTVTNHNDLSGLQGGTAGEYYHLTAAQYAALQGGAYLFNARLTLETGVPVSTTAQLAKTELFLTKSNGDQLSFYDGISSWSNITLGADVSIKATDSQTGTTTNGSPVITGLTDTSQLVVGMKVSGTGIAANSVISTINSATQVTLNNNATASGTVTITFKLPASTTYDVFCKNNSGTAKLKFVAGTSSRTTQNGIDVLSGETTYRLVGTVTTTTTDGQMEISPTFIGVSNLYNLEKITMYICPGYNDNTAYTTYAVSSATWVEANGTNNGRLRFVLCKPQGVSMTSVIGCTPATSNFVVSGVAYDSVTDPKAMAFTPPGPNFATIPTTNNNQGLPLAVGYHYCAMLLASLVGTATIYADYGGARAGASFDPPASFMTGEILF